MKDSFKGEGKAHGELMYFWTEGQFKNSGKDKICLYDFLFSKEAVGEKKACFLFFSCGTWRKTSLLSTHHVARLWL